MLVALCTENEAAETPPKRTAVAPVKFVPLMLTSWLEEADAGEKEVMVGTAAASQVKPANVAVPVGVVTEILPVAPSPTTAMIVVASIIAKEAAATAPKRTAVAPLRWVPRMVTDCPFRADVGAKEERVGTVEGAKVNPANEAVPAGVTTDTEPLDPAPTTAVIVTESTTEKEAAAVPPKRTAVAPRKLAPLMSTAVPAPPELGEKEVSVGGLTTWTESRDSDKRCR